MRGYLQAIEAAIAIMLLLTAFEFLLTMQFTFKPHETRALSTIASSVLQTYHPVIDRYIAVGDLKALESLLDSVIPTGYGYLFQIDYLEPVRVLYGSTGSRPAMFATELSYSVDAGSVQVRDDSRVAQDTQVVWDWYRIPFQIVNNEEARDYQAVLPFALAWQDSNNDGFKEPIDQGSVQLYLNSTFFNYTLVNATPLDEGDLVYLNATIPLRENEVVDGFVYFKVIA